MFLVNSRLGLFSAAPFGAPLIPKLRGNFAEFLNNPSPVGLRILRSYGVILPSSLTTLLPLALGFSPHLPVSVCGTGDNPSPVGLRILSSSTCVGLRYGHLSIHIGFSRLGASRTSLLYFSPFRPGQPTPGFRYLQVSPMLKVRWLRNFYRMCIDYAFRPRLSPRLTLGGRTFPKKP